MTIAALTPEFGWTAGINPKGNGLCDGSELDSTGQPIEIPCTCPPPRDLFIQDMIINVDAGFSVNNTNVLVGFPTANTSAALVTRIQTAITTLQNLFGVGGGCPVSSTTFSEQLNAAINAQR